MNKPLSGTQSEYRNELERRLIERPLRVMVEFEREGYRRGGMRGVHRRSDRGSKVLWLVGGGDVCLIIGTSHLDSQQFKDRFVFYCKSVFTK